MGVTIVRCVIFKTDRDLKTFIFPSKVRCLYFTDIFLKFFFLVVVFYYKRNGIQEFSQFHPLS